MQSSVSKYISQFTNLDEIKLNDLIGSHLDPCEYIGDCTVPYDSQNDPFDPSGKRKINCHNYCQTVCIQKVRAVLFHVPNIVLTTNIAVQTILEPSVTKLYWHNDLAHLSVELLNPTGRAIVTTAEWKPKIRPLINGIFDIENVPELLCPFIMAYQLPIDPTYWTIDYHLIDRIPVSRAQPKYSVHFEGKADKFWSDNKVSIKQESRDIVSVTLQKLRKLR